MSYFYISLADRIVAFFSFILLARIFDSQLYGKISTVFAVSTILVSILDFGLPIYTQRESSKTENLSDILANVFSVKIPFLILYIFILPLVSWVFLKDISWGMVIIIGAIILLQSISNLLSYAYFGKDNSKLVLRVNIVSKIFFLIVITTSYFFLRNIYFFLSGYVIAYVYTLLVFTINLKHYKVEISKLILNFKKLKFTLAIIIPIGISSAFNLIYDKIDIVILSAYLDYNKVAQYSVAYTIYRLSGIVFGIILYPALNQFSRLAENFAENLKILLKYLVTIIFVSAIIILIYIFIISPLIPFVFGIHYLEASKIIIPLSFAVILWAMNSITGVYLNGLGQFKYVMAATLSGMIFNITINIILIPIIGVMGAVYSTLGTEFIIFLIEICIVYIYIKNNYRR
jgi:O-antigen/teichoic acid export membrane protein